MSSPITLNEGSQFGSQPAYMEHAAIIIELTIRRWKLPTQQGDIIYSDCKSLTDVIKSSAPPLSKPQLSYPFSKRFFAISKPSAPKGSPLTGPNPIQNDDPRQSNKHSMTGAYYSRTVQHPTIQSQAKSGSNNIFSSRSQCYSRPPLTRAHGSSASPRDLTTFTYLANKRNQAASSSI